MRKPTVTMPVCSSQTEGNVVQSTVESLTVAPGRRGRAPRVEVALSDGRVGVFHPDLVVELGLRRGMELSSSEDWARLLARQAALDARHRLVRLLSIRKKTEFEARLYLERLGFPPEAVNAAIVAARDLGHLDDRDYAGAYVRTMDRAGRDGPRAIEAGLRRRGVGREVAAEAIAPIEDESAQRPKALAIARKRHAQLAARQRSQLRPATMPEYGMVEAEDQDGSVPIDDVETPQTERSREKASRWGRRVVQRRSAEETLRQKISDTLLRRGFTADIVRSVVDEVIAEAEGGPAQ